MDAFRVDSVEVAVKLALVGLLTGVIFYALEKYVIVPGESALKLA
jgi:hypothetical protein